MHWTVGIAEGSPVLGAKVVVFVGGRSPTSSRQKHPDVSAAFAIAFAGHRGLPVELPITKIQLLLIYVNSF